MQNSKQVTYNNHKYVVFQVKYQDHSMPVILDKEDFDLINKMNKNWRCNKNGFVYCTHTYDGITKDVYIHELVMLSKNKNKSKSNSIVHINRVGLDNRRENLIYDTHDKDYNKNTKKKSRTIQFSEESGIVPSEIPTYIWYAKPDTSHGERFIVSIGDVTWKSSSSNDLSLRYKLEEAKMFLRNLLRDRQDLFNEYSMNGDYTKEGKKLLNSYYDIVHSVGYDNIHRFVPENNTFELLAPSYDNLDTNEKLLLFEKRRKIKNDI